MPYSKRELIEQILDDLEELQRINARPENERDDVIRHAQELVEELLEVDGAVL